MKKIFALIMVCLLVFGTSRIAYADSSDYTDGELNMIANTVNGEVGGITGTILLTYSDGSCEYVDGSRIRQIHAKIVDNQVKSDLFPNSVYGCVSQCWSTGYLGTGWKSSWQWQRAREDTIKSLDDVTDAPNNLYAATCDGRFAQKYSGFYLWARVDWNTGWCSGTFFYYTYGYPTYDEIEEEEDGSETWSVKMDLERKERFTK